MTAFLLWCDCFLLFLILGIFCYFSRKQVGFFANIKPFPVKDVRAYNRSCGRLWMGYSLVGMVLGFPLLDGQNSALVLLSVLGVMGDTLGLILLHILVIEKKHKAQ